MDISYLLFLQDIRNATGGAANGFFLLATSCGEALIQTLVIAALFWCINKKWGQVLLFANVASAAALFVAKITACVYRPFIRDTRLIPVEKASGYCFPSGHSARAGAFWGGLAVLFRQQSRDLTTADKQSSHRLCILFFIMMLLVMFSRNYLGVHTPQDVILGGLLGVVVFILSQKVLAWAEGNVKRENIFAAGIVVASVLIVAYASLKSYPMDMINGKLIVAKSKLVADSYGQAGDLVGFAVGWLIEKRFICFDISGSWQKRLFRFVLGAIGLVIFMKVVKGCIAPILGSAGANFVSGFLTLIYILVIYPWFCKVKNL